ncbi:hypothetical protein K470DRAFT_221031 [Piedraia hortae CBS 480.64]|uniref:Uncharacterized protein n=1 Tax=Piedraia hortae CBS 480.64 TaxID=1314780 RepID=A0A6A7BUA6_9PEZI|nr:hypothetical protein K470DRAFT_221031 [Piedraia hortae CBS 480.64]
MGLLKHLRSRTNLRNAHSPPAPTFYQYQGRDYTRELPDKVLEAIFAYVCPHTQDFGYESSERSQIGEGCMLCDLRDLASCAKQCKKWYAIAQRLLYTSVRIDAVHFCALEEELAEKRKKSVKHFRKNSSLVEPGEVPAARLSLLCRTVRANDQLAHQVLLLKLPYMTRETCKGDLARTVAALPNLRYVDLPDEFFTGDPNCLPLRQEVQTNCPNIRRMSYKKGSEEYLQMLARPHWKRLEVLELQGLAVEPSIVRIVLASLANLRSLTLSNLPWLDDEIFRDAGLPAFPPLQDLTLKVTPNVTAQGLVTYLETSRNRETLVRLSLEETGVLVTELNQVLWAASQLRHLSVQETVSKSLTLTMSQLPPLASISLKTLHYEITSAEDVHSLQKPAESYYAYLISSLHQNALPGLQSVFVRDPNFAELLVLPAPPGEKAKAGPSGGMAQTLEVFSKGIDELEWVFSLIRPPPPSGNNGSTMNRGSMAGGRPLSAYSASRGLGPQWSHGGFGGEARKSVVVGNGFGGFLAVPQEEMPRPRTADSSKSGSSRRSLSTSFLKPPTEGFHHERRQSRHDLWR